MITMYVCVMPSFLPKKPNIFVCGFFVKNAQKNTKKTNKNKLIKIIGSLSFHRKFIYPLDEEVSSLGWANNDLGFFL